MPLDKKATIGTWIKDFKKSDAPQFKGKNEKDRRDMAIAAYLNKEDTNQNFNAAEKKERDIDKLKSRIRDHQARHDHAHAAAKEAPNEGQRKRHQDKKATAANHMSALRDKINQIQNESTLNEDMNFRVEVEGLPAMFMYGSGPAQIKTQLRKIVKQPSMITSVKRVTDAEVKRSFRLKAQGRDDDSDGEIDSRQEEGTMGNAPEWGTNLSTIRAKQKTPGQ
tara:strand:- start:339 stop:1004 length:666 start_codon:yes stop_codon:yes gene_type:complete